jgi:hypothetical protein
MKMTPDRWWALAAFFGVLLILWSAYRGRIAWARYRVADDFAVADRAPVYDGDQMAQLQREIHHDTAQHRTIGDDEYRTRLMALAEPAPVYVPVVDDYITGEIVKISDVPPHKDTTTSILARIEEMRTDWHWIENQFHAPTALIDSLPKEDWLNPGEPDWLRQLLQDDLVPA